MQSSRPHNRRLVLETVRISGPLSRTDLARTTGLTNQTVANLVELLLAEGLVREAGRRAPSRGQPARDLVLRPEGAYAAGLHLDRRAWCWLITDLAGAPLARESGTFEPGAAASELRPLWKAAWRRLRAGFPEEAPFWGVGVAGPGPQEAGVLRSPPDFPGWDGVDLKGLAQEITGLEAWVENDARAAAAGELWSGCGRRHPDFLYLYCSWAFGLGVVIDGVLRRGSRGLAGEAFRQVPWTDAPGTDKAAVLDSVLGTLVKALDFGAVVVGGTWPPAPRQDLARALGRLWSQPVLASSLEDAAAVGAASLVLTRRLEGA